MRFLDSIYYLEGRSRPLGLQDARDDGAQGAGHDEDDTQQHIKGDLLPVEPPGQDGRQGGFEEVDQGDHAGRLVLHGQEVGAEADARHAGGDVEHVGQVLQGVTGQQGDVGEGGQPGGVDGGGNGRNVAHPDEDQDDQTAEQKAEAGDHRSAVPSHLFFAHDPVDGEQDGGRQGQDHPHGVQLGVEGVDDGDGSRHLQHQGGDVPHVDGLAQEQEGQEGDEHRVTAEQHRHHPGVGVVDRELIDGHADGDAHQAQQGKIA